MATTYTAKGDEQGNVLKNYSTDEVLTGGVWIDGSPIYRIVINKGVINNEQFVSYTIDSEPIKNIITGIAICLRNITYISSNIDNEVLVFDFGSTKTGQSYIILEYTKNTI